MKWHTADTRNPPSPWTRVLALLCLCLLVMTSSAQAMHVHHGLLPASPHANIDHTSQFTGDTESSCPLCASLHTILYLGSTACVEVALHASQAVPIHGCAKQGAPQHFALFTRPPPALL